MTESGGGKTLLSRFFIEKNRDKVCVCVYM